jgi:fumarate hydratase subunit beta
MDTHTPALLAGGLKAVIGKGPRGKEVVEALKRYKAVYFAGFAGIGVINSKRIKEAEVVAYDDLGPEAIRRLVVEDFPVIVANDIYGNDIYEREKKRYRTISDS